MMNRLTDFFAIFVGKRVMSEGAAQSVEDAHVTGAGSDVFLRFFRCFRRFFFFFFFLFLVADVDGGSARFEPAVVTALALLVGRVVPLGQRAEPGEPSQRFLVTERRAFAALQSRRRRWLLAAVGAASSAVWGRERYAPFEGPCGR